MRSTKSRAMSSIALVAILTSGVPPARAEPTEHDLLYGEYQPPRPADPAAVAAALIRAAQDDYKSKNYVRAIARLERAYALLPEPRVLFNLARSHHRAGNLERAERY